MKVAQVCPYFYPEMIGGIEWYVLNICRELARQGRDLHVFTANLRHGQRIGPDEDVVDGIYVHRLPLLVDLTYRAKLWRGLYSRLTEEHFDLIHMYDYAQVHSFISAHAGRRHNIPTVMTVFDLHFMIPHPLYKRLAMTMFDRIFARGILRRVDRLLVRTPILIHPLVSLGARKENIVITPSGIRKEALEQMNGESFRKKHDITGPLVLYIGRLHPMKGPQFLIQAVPNILKHVSDVSIVIIGPDQVNYQKDLLHLAERLNVTDHIHFVGPIYDFTKKMEAYAACNVLALPSGYEGFGQVLVEAMAQGKPVVTTKVGSIPWLISSGKEGLLVDYGNPVELAEALITILEDNKRATAMGRAGRKKAEEFTYNKLAEQLAEIYEETILKKSNSTI